MDPHLRRHGAGESALLGSVEKVSRQILKRLLADAAKRGSINVYR
jgi:hypothetical protein